MAVVVAGLSGNAGRHEGPPYHRGAVREQGNIAWAPSDMAVELKATVRMVEAKRPLSSRRRRTRSTGRRAQRALAEV